MSVSDRIDLYIQDLTSLLPMNAEDKHRLDKKFRLEFNFNSNHMEGNTLTYSETELLLIFDDVKGNHTLRELEEMKAHDVAYKFIEELAADKERPLTEQIIKNLNEMILVRPFWKDAQTAEGQPTRRQIKVGDYKEFPNSVRLQNGEMFHYASPIDTPIKMAELMDWYRTEESHLHPLTLAAMLHYKFVCIHPFDDGNGRISRLLMNYVLLKNNLPPVIIKSKEKSGYLSALHQADVGNYEDFISYIGEQLEWSLDLSIKVAKGESIEEVDDLDKEIELLKYNNSNTSVEKNNPVLLNNVYNESIKPIISEFINELNKFDSLFDTTTINFFLKSNMQTKSFYILKDFDEIFSGSANEHKLNRTLSHYPSVIEEIEVSIRWNGYKNNGIDVFDSFANIKLQFENYRYNLSYMYNPTNERKYLYKNPIVKEDRDIIIHDIKKTILNDIKIKTSSNL